MLDSLSMNVRSQRGLAFGLAIAALSVCACGGDSATTPSTVPSGSGEIKLVAVVTNRSGSCPTITFKLGGISVRTTSTTTFKLPCEAVINGAAIEAAGPGMSGGALLSRAVESDGDAWANPDFEATGPVDSVSSVEDCVKTDGRSVSVLGLRFAASSFTRFDGLAGGCVGLTSGIRIQAKGSLSNPPSAPVLPARATEVELRP